MAETAATLDRCWTRCLDEIVHPRPILRLGCCVAAALASNPVLAQRAVEAWQPDAGRGARASAIVRIGTERGFGMSDVVVAKHIVPRDSAPARWTDYVITPSAGMLAQRQSFGLVWETYELQPSEGSVNYRVEIVLTVVAVERPENFVARIVGGVADVVGLSARGDTRVALSYNRQRDARAVVTDDVTLELGSAPAGRYRLTVQITDLATGRTANRTRELTVAP